MYDAEPVGAVLVGRDRQRRELSEWLAARTGAVVSGPPVALIGGEAGVGKTALVEWMLADWSTLGRSTGAPSPFDSGPITVRRGAGTPWSPWPADVLRPVLPDGPPAADTIAAVVRSALTGPAEPVVLVLDDLHWADDTSLTALPAIAAAIAADPVAIIGIYRTDELPRGHLLRPVRAALRHARHLCELPLGALDDAAVRQLIMNLVGGPPSDELVAVVSSRTEGVPFFIEQLIAALRSGGRLVPDGDRVTLATAPEVAVPETVRDAIMLRLAPVSAAARIALGIAAVLGADFDVDGVTDLSGQPWPDELDHSGLLTVGDGGRRRFRHALAHEAVYGEVPWPRRRAWHLAVADRLTAAGAPAAAIARHLIAARDMGRARSVLVAAAKDQARAYAYRDAARFLRMALESWPAGRDEPGRRDVLDRFVRCAEATGDHATAVAGLRELAEPPAVGVAAVHRRLAVQFELQGLWPLALAAREAAAASYAVQGDWSDAAAERLIIAAHLRSAASFRAALDVLDIVLADVSIEKRPDLFTRAEALRGNVLARMGRPEEGLAVVRAALDAALHAGLPIVAAEIYQRLADSLEHAGDYRAASRAYDAAFEFCQARGDLATGELCRACATVVLFHAGQWDRATRLCREVLETSTAGAHARTVASGVLGLVAAMRGRPGPARAALLEARATAVRIDLVAMELLSTWGLALVEEAAGRFDRAAALYRTAVARARETEERHYCVPVLQFAVGCFAQAGPEFASDVGAATAVVSAAAEATGAPEAQSALAYALAESALADGAPERADVLFREALDRLSGQDLPIIDSYVRLRAAQALAGTENATPQLRDASARSLGQAYRTMRRLGAGPLAARIRDAQESYEPVRSTSGSPAASGSGADTLTARELEVLRLVGQGHTSRDIAQRLFLSVRTVEMHVQHAMAKLGCRTRAAAVRRLLLDG